MFLESFQHKYLYAGEVFVTNRPYLIKTVLGSCVSIFLWDKANGVAGVNHYLSPVGNAKDPSSFKYAEPSSKHMLKRMFANGAERKNISAMVFGGGSVIESMFNIGAGNVISARGFLEKEGIRVKHWDVAGNNGRRLTFNTQTSEVHVSIISKIAWRSDQDGAASSSIEKQQSVVIKPVLPEDFPVFKPVKPILP